MYLDFCRLFELIQSEFSLDHRCLDHQELELSEGTVSLVATPGRLDFYCSHYQAIGSLVLVTWVLDRIIDLDSIGHT